MTFIRCLRGLLLALSSVFVVGCAGLVGAPSEPPRVSLADIGIEEIGLLEQKLRLELRVQNPNEVTIGIAGLSYVLEVNGRKFADGVSDQAVRVPRFGEATLNVGAVTGLAGMLRQFRELQKGGREVIDYRLSGKLMLESGGSVPFEQRGEVPLPSLFGDPAPARRGT